MRHCKRAVKLNKNSAHRRCMFANLLKALIEHGRIETTISKAKELRRHAERIITLAKTDSLSSRRKAIAKLMIRFNPLSSKEVRMAKQEDFSSYNTDRRVIRQLFGTLAQRYVDRNGGYTRIMRKENRRGDSSLLCIIEYVC